MDLPRHFAVDDPAALHALMRRHALATLVYLADDGTPDADPVPPEGDAAAGPHGTLRGHVARANPLWKLADDRPVLAAFRGEEACITPSAYPSTAERQRVVPTWNCAVVHARGTLRAVDDAPEACVQQMLRASVGIEIVVERLVGKFKLSQNRTPADRDGEVAALQASADPGERATAALMRGG
jgi:transcriptional regulator